MVGVPLVSNGLYISLLPRSQAIYTLCANVPTILCGRCAARFTRCLSQHAGRARTAVIDARLLSTLHLVITCPCSAICGRYCSRSYYGIAGFRSCHCSLSYPLSVSRRHAQCRSSRATMPRLSGDPATPWPILEWYLRLLAPHLTSFVTQAVFARCILFRCPWERHWRRTDKHKTL